MNNSGKYFDLHYNEYKTPRSHGVDTVSMLLIR